MTEIQCPKCAQMVLRRNLKRHINRNCPRKCPVESCQFAAKNQSDVDYHYARRHQPGPSDSSELFVCAVCKETFHAYHALQRHKNERHGTSRRINQNVTVDLAAFTSNTNAQEVLRDYKHFLVDSSMETKMQKTINFPQTEFKAQEINAKLDGFVATLPWAAKISITLGYLLINVTSGEFRYFYAQNNFPLFEDPVLVQTTLDLENLKKRIEDANYIQNVTAVRPCTLQLYSLGNSNFSS